MNIRQYISVFQNRNLALMTVADAVSIIGDAVGWIALLWFTTVTVHLPQQVGLLGLVYGLPSVFLGAVVGMVLDSVSKRFVLVSANVLLGAVFLVIPALQQVQALSFATLLTLVFVAGCLTPFINIGWMVILPNVVPSEEIGTANASFEVIWQAASLLGPALAGLLISRWSSSVALLLDAISFFAAAACTLCLQLHQTSPESNHSELLGRRRTSFFREICTGFANLFRMKSVWLLTVGALVLNLAYGALEISLPLLTHNQLRTSAVILGAMWTTYFVASIIGSAFSAFLSTRRKIGIWMAMMAALWGLSFVPLLWIHGVWMVFVSMACGGLLFSGYPPLARTMVQRLVPATQQGRIMGIRGAVIGIGVPAGSYLSGMLGNWLDPASVIGCVGLMVVVAGIFLATRPSFRDM